jgi:nucleoside-triphosphatase THEP1
MRRIKLEDQEYKDMIVIIDEYKEIEFQLTKVQSQLEKLSTEQNSMLNKLETNRESENAFFSKIEKRYGKGAIDLLTMEYVLK